MADEPIKRRTSTGAIISFPAGTPPEKIDAVMASIENRVGQNVQPVQPGDQNPEIARAMENLRLWDGRLAQSYDQLREMHGPMDATDTAVAGLGRLANATMLGFADEIAGVGGGIVDSFREGGTFARGYERNRDATRWQLQRFGEENPDWALGLDIGGSLIPAGPAFMGAARTGSLAGRATRVGSVGAGYGAAAGFGSAEGGWEDRLGGALVGGGVGGVVGAALPPTLSAIGAIGRAGGDVARNVAGRARNALDAARGRPPSWSRVADDSERLVIQSLGRDRFMPQPGRPILSQLTGQTPNTLSLARAIWSTPGEGRTRLSMFLDEAQASQHENLLSATSMAMRAEPETFYRALENLDDARRAAATPAYRELYEQVGVVTDPRVLAEMQRPDMQLAMREGLQMLQREDIPLDELVVRGPDGSIVGYHMQLLDYTKRGLDDLTALAANKPNSFRSLSILTSRFRGLLDEVTEVDGASLYRNARDVWSGPTGSMNATEAGRAAWRRGQNADLIRREMEALPEADRDFYRLGAMRQMFDEVTKLPDQRDAAGKFLTAAARQRLTALIDDPTLSEDMFRQIENLYGVARADRGIRGGSTTAPTQAGMDDILDTVRAPGESLLSFFGRLSRGEGPVNAMMGVFSDRAMIGMQRRLGLGRWRTQNPRVQAAMEGAARILTGEDLARGASYSTRLSERALARGEREGRRYRTTRGTGATVGNYAGNDGD